MGSPKYSLDLADLQHILTHALMCFLSAAPAVIYVHGALDWTTCEALLVTSVLFAGQSTAREWLKDNSLDGLPPGINNEK